MSEGKLSGYLKFYDKYLKIYGSKIAVLYQIGQFHEIYGVDNEHEKQGNVTELASVLSIKETRCNTKILENSRNNPQMAGFNSVSLDENVDKLISYGYTVIVVNQVPSTDPIQRKLAYIESPSTSTSINLHNKKDPYLLSIYLDSCYCKSIGKNLNYIGMAAIDNTTGKSYFYESSSTSTDPTLAEDNLTRFIQTFSPVEVIFNCSSKVNGNVCFKDELVKLWGFRLKDSMQDQYDVRPTLFADTYKPLANIELQEEFLSKYFTGNDGINILEYLDLVRYPSARNAFIYMLDFCSNHNSRILINLDPPHIWSEGSGKLVLDTSSSMLAEDFKPNRLEAVKQAAKDFIDNRKGDRVGLLVFGKETFIQCPLTVDYGVLNNLLSEVTVVEPKYDGTAIGIAIANAVNRLRVNDSKSKVIILLSDGSNNAGAIDPIAAAKIAKEYNIRIYTIGAGTRQAVTQIPGGRYIRNEIDEL